MAISGIYKIQSSIKPERIYIGSSSNIMKRWREHLCNLRLNQHENKKLQNHYNKYKDSDLIFTILLGCEVNDLVKVEQYFLDSYNPYFNICKVAGSCKGIKLTEEHKNKLRIAHLGKKLSEEHIQKIKLKNKGKKRSEEYCKYLSERNKKNGIIPPSQKGRRKQIA